MEAVGRVDRLGWLGRLGRLGWLGRLGRVGGTSGRPASRLGSRFKGPRSILVGLSSRS